MITLLLAKNLSMQVSSHEFHKFVLHVIKVFQLAVLLCSIGRILDDASVLSDHAIDEKKFIVIMVTKPKAAEASPVGPADPTVPAQTAPPATTPAAVLASTPTTREEPASG